MRKIIVGMLSAAVLAWLPSTGAWALSATNATYVGPYACSASVGPEVSFLLAFCETNESDSICIGLTAVDYGHGIPLGERFTEEYKVVPHGDGKYENGKLRIQFDAISPGGGVAGCACIFTLNPGASNYNVFAAGYGFETLQWSNFADQCDGHCGNNLNAWKEGGFVDSTAFILQDITSTVPTNPIGDGTARGTKYTDNNLNDLGEAGAGSCNEMVAR